MTISSGLGLLFGIHKCKKRDKMAETTSRWFMATFRSNDLTLITRWLDDFETGTSSVDIVSTFQSGKWVYVLVKVVMDK